MFTHLIRVLLRILAGAALATATASVVIGQFLAPAVTPVVHKSKLLPNQHYTVSAEAELPELVEYDVPRIINPPKPKPKPSKVPRAARAQVAAPHRDTPVTTASAAQAYARAKVGSGQFGCLLNLWNRESGWNVHANNPASGAYGIPQSLPGSKMAAAGGDWQNNAVTQINWGLGYISGRYGSPCGAWAHSEAFGWY